MQQDTANGSQLAGRFLPKQRFMDFESITSCKTACFNPKSNQIHSLHLKRETGTRLSDARRLGFLDLRL